MWREKNCLETEWQCWVWDLWIELKPWSWSAAGCNIQDGNMRMVRAQPCWWASLPQIIHLWLLERFLHWLQCEELMLLIGSCLRYFSCCIPEEKFPVLTFPVLISFHQQSCSQGGWCCHTHSKEGCEEVWWGRHCFYFLFPLFLTGAILWWVDSEDDLMSCGVCRNFLPTSSRKEVSEQGRTGKQFPGDVGGGVQGLEVRNRWFLNLEMGLSGL